MGKTVIHILRSQFYETIVKFEIYLKDFRRKDIEIWVQNKSQE